MSFIEHFSTIADPRSHINVKHDFPDILFLTVSAVISGAEGWKDIKEFGDGKLAWLRAYRSFSNGVPVDDTIARVVRGIRRHWEVENKAHWVLDVAFKEDDSRIRTGDGAGNVGIIRRFCLNLARLHPQKNSMRGKLKQAGWSDARRAVDRWGRI